ncbi:MAG: hypothetical protein KAT46_03875 [Deltaproteobacteria bacterium]|nr:hypothetical protein [Deltaproteobacteria bacterium]
MKKIILTIGVLFLLYGCVPGMMPYPQGSPSFDSIPGLNEKYAASMGDTFFKYSVTNNRGGSPNNWKFDLTVVELTPEKLSLQYSEYTLYTNPYSYVTNWMIKNGFNKTLNYSLKNKTIHFKNYIFEVQSIENGKIRYKRTR